MMENVKKNLLYIVIGILVLICITIAATYAYFAIDTAKSQTLGNLAAAAECIDIEYSEANTIDLDYEYPITDAYALENVTPVTVTVTNKCSNNTENINYTLALTTLTKDSNYISDDKMRINVKSKLGSANETTLVSTNYLNSLTSLTSGNAYTYLQADLNNRADLSAYTGRTSYTIDSTSIANNTVNTYKIYLWVDYYEGDTSKAGLYNNSTEGKTFTAAISLIVNAEAKNSGGGIKFNKTYAVNIEGTYSEIVFREDGSTTWFISGIDGGTVQYPAGTLTYNGANIFMGGELFASVLADGNALLLTSGDVLLYQSQTSPIKFGETYVGNFEGQSAEVIFYENGSVTLDANGSIQQLPAGTVTYDGLLGLNQYGDLLISTTNDGSIVYFLPNGKFGEHCIVSLETSSTPIKFRKTYVGNFEGTYTEMILFEDGSVTLDANGSTQQLPIGTLTYDGVNILMGGEDFAVVSADGNILMSLNGDMLALID